MLFATELVKRMEYCLYFYDSHERISMTMINRLIENLFFGSETHDSTGVQTATCHPRHDVSSFPTDTEGVLNLINPISVNA